MNGVLRVLAVVALAQNLPSLAGEFTYSIPPGWRDMRQAISASATAAQRDISEIPMNVTQDAGSGRYAMMAIDPKGTTRDRAAGMMNAVEMKTTGQLTLANVKEAADGMKQMFVSRGLGSDILSTEMVKLNGINVGRTVLDVSSPVDSRRVLQYIIPGRTGSTVLSYSAPKEEFAAYGPVFEASAKETRGGYNHGGIDWKRVLVSGGIAALLGGAASLVFALRRRRAGEVDEPVSTAQAMPAPVAATSAPPARTKSTKYTWMCGACGNPVPLRLDQCRCGAAKPA